MLSVSNTSKSYGDRILFSTVSFDVGARDRVAVIAPNGSGKATLLISLRARSLLIRAI